MSLFNRKLIACSGFVYEFHENELNHLITDYLKKKIDVSLDMCIKKGIEVDMDDEPFVILWDDNGVAYEKMSEEQIDKIYELALYVDCPEDNRDSLLSGIFQHPSEKMRFYTKTNSDKGDVFGIVLIKDPSKHKLLPHSYKDDLQR